jgi:hypothetical protein
VEVKNLERRQRRERSSDRVERCGLFADLAAPSLPAVLRGARRGYDLFECRQHLRELVAAAMEFECMNGFSANNYPTTIVPSTS